MFLAVLGRQSEISLAELESIYGAANLTPLSNQLALINTPSLDLSRLGGTIKAGKIISEPLLDYLANLPPGKITLGFSDYSPSVTAKSAQMQALKLKSVLKRRGRSVRIVPNNSSAALSSATSHHNQLGEKVNHIEVINYQKYTALSIGTQNITAYAKRDQARPARDAYVGMLPPKLAQILVNLATGPQTSGLLLDPFCGTGTILQEALLMGYSVYGTDLSEKIVAYSQKNLDWLAGKHSLLLDYPQSRRGLSDVPRNDGRAERVQKQAVLAAGDATNFTWQQPIDFVASETYLGQPFSAPPSDIKLKEVQFTTKSILLSFLKNIHPQLKPNTPLALAIPAWRRPDHSFSHLNIVDEIQKLGYNVCKFKHATPTDLLYYRENQIVARQIILLRKS